MKLLFFLTLIPQITAMFIGGSTSALQVEGSTTGNSIWEPFLKERNLHPIGNATNHFLLYKEDVKLLSDLNLKHYRFSISWSRIMPKTQGVVDPDGIQFYHNLIDELLKYNITPYVTLFHWEIPAYLYPGWTDPRIVDAFLNYSKVIFKEYHSKVNYWITINEPLTTSEQGYEKGSFAPGLKGQGRLSGHYQLLAHAKVANYFKKNYKGKIGMALNSNWIQQINSKTNVLGNIEVVKMLGWFADPLFFGKYPDELRGHVPNFTESESKSLINSVDFFGLNHYTTYLINSKGHYSTDPMWVQGESNWLFDVPYGMYKILHFIKDRYGNIPIFITESGFSMKEDHIFDYDRVNYLSGYISKALQAKKEGVNVQGFFVWSFLDNFEWASGYNETFGIVYVNRTDYSRTVKASGKFISQYVVSS
jgi:beta-glucosidase